MIVCALAAPLDCRDGNCPTVWLTDKGTLVVQGYLVADATTVAGGKKAGRPARGRAVELPGDVLRRATAAISARSEMQGGRTFGDVTPTARGTYVVRGRSNTPDVIELPVPRGEGAVEVAPGALRRALAHHELQEAM